MKSVPKAQLFQWFGQTELQRDQYQFVWDVACKLDKLWSTEGIHAIVLKGRSIAKYYPVPSHRYSCDLDVYIGQGWERACELLGLCEHYTKLFADVNEHLKEMMTQLIASKEVADGLGRK